jgi:hypothetical protein
MILETFSFLQVTITPVLTTKASLLRPCNRIPTDTLPCEQVKPPWRKCNNITMAFLLSSSSLFSATKPPSSSLSKMEYKEQRERIQYNWNEANFVNSVRLRLDWMIGFVVWRFICIPWWFMEVPKGICTLADLEATNSSCRSGDCLKRVHVSHLEVSIDTESPEQSNEAMDVWFENYDDGGVSPIASKRIGSSVRAAKVASMQHSAKGLCLALFASR